MREQMQVHRANPVCASCHSRMDPIGFALENYDGVGKWRDEDAGAKIDASGTLPDGTVFHGPAGLRQLLLTKYKDDFVHTAIEKLLTYSLGRGLESYDFPTVRAITREAAQDNYRFASLIAGVVPAPGEIQPLAVGRDGWMFLNLHLGVELRHQRMIVGPVGLGDPQAHQNFVRGPAVVVMPRVNQPRAVGRVRQEKLGEVRLGEPFDRRRGRFVGV